MNGAGHDFVIGTCNVMRDDSATEIKVNPI